MFDAYSLEELVSILIAAAWLADIVFMIFCALTASKA